MEDIIKLESKSNTINYLKKLSKPNGESKTYVLKTNAPTVSVGFTDNRNKFIGLSNDLIITEGNLLTEANAIVKSIDYTIGYGYTITFT